MAGKNSSFHFRRPYIFHAFSIPRNSPGIATARPPYNNKLLLIWHNPNVYGLYSFLLFLTVYSKYILRGEGPNIFVVIITGYYDIGRIYIFILKIPVMNWSY